MASDKERGKMEELRKVARAYFDGQNEDDRLHAEEFFQSLDENGDGTVTLEEYRKHVDSRFSNDHLFDLLDANGDGSLDMEEFLTLYYMDNVLIPRCAACNVMLLSSLYFSCLPCLGKSSYHLCCSCYGGRRFEHRHLSSEFADTRTLLMLMDRLMKDAMLATTDPTDVPTEVQKHASSSSSAKPPQPSPTLARSESEAPNRAISYPTPTPSKTGKVVKKLAVCATKAILIKGAVGVAAVACTIM